MKKNNLYLSLLSLIFLASCATSIEPKINDDSTESLKFSENQDNKFEAFLEDQWNSDLADSPVFASNLGIKKYNTKISSNSISQFNTNKNKEKLKLKKLQSFNIDDLNQDNKLNYKLAELGILNSIKRMEYPSYYMQLNQRGIGRASCRERV